MKNIKKLITPLILLALPVVTSAQLTGTARLIDSAGRLVKDATVVVSGLALLVFFWGLVKFIMSAGPGGKADGKQLMIWGTIALFVMVSIWGIVHFIGGEILGEGNQYVPAPQIPIFRQ